MNTDDWVGRRPVKDGTRPNHPLPDQGVPDPFSATKACLATPPAVHLITPVIGYFPGATRESRGISL